MIFEEVYKGKTVLVTGHTGFKGSWLSEWLCLMGAKVVGFSLPPDPAVDLCYTTPYAHFNELSLGDQLAAHVEGDVRSLSDVSSVIAEHQPDFIFNLAAQPLVLRGTEEPHLTFETNLLGSLNLLEAVRVAGLPCVIVMITTDKVYENAEWEHSYREPDRLGGRDPYSASKACVELMISSYWRTFFAPKLGELGIAMAPVRGGNVIGGGDWAKDRIVPDSVKALSEDKPIEIRNRHATRPWQNVMDLLSGYLHLGTLIYRRREAFSAAAPADREAAFVRLNELCTPFNFGPHLASNRSVGELVEEILKNWPGEALDKTVADAPKEAGKLNLTIDKAYHVLGWQPKWDFAEALQYTIEWYRQFYAEAKGSPEVVRALTQQQIRAYSEGLHYTVNS